jgi:serine/threonine protein kinase
MGAVYLARDTSLDREVAIKFLVAETAGDESARKRLIREARAAARLDHPNICSVHEVAEHEGLAFIVMQHIEGYTLSDRIKRKPLDVREAIEIAAQAADALAEAHSHGIIHRDIKPANIMITARGQAKVMDFGLAKVIRDRSSSESQAVTETILTEPGAIVGTIPYMSPEQVQGVGLDVRSDIFSFGAVLYEMITGHTPFEAKNAAALISAILSREPMPLTRYAVDVPTELERISRKCLEKDRDRRYQTMRDVAIDLENLRSEHAGARVISPGEELATEGVRVVLTGEVIKRPSVLTTRRALVFYGVAAMLVAAAIVYVLVFSGATATRQPEIKSIAVLPLENLSGDPAQELCCRWNDRGAYYRAVKGQCVACDLPDISDAIQRCAQAAA